MLLVGLLALTGSDIFFGTEWKVRKLKPATTKIGTWTVEIRRIIKYPAGYFKKYQQLVSLSSKVHSTLLPSA